MGYFRRPLPHLPLFVFKQSLTPDRRRDLASPYRFRHGTMRAMDLASQSPGTEDANSVPRAIQQVFAQRARRAIDRKRIVMMETRPACISIADVQHAVARTFCLSIGEMLRASGAIDWPARVR
jgi:hypothetical protein